MSLTYCPCICFSFHLFSISRFSLFWYSFGYFASSTFTVSFSPTFPSNTFSEFLTYQLKLFSSPQTQASQLMSPLPESFPLLPWYIYSCSTTSAVQLLLGTLRSNDADGNENVKKNNRFYKQNINFARASRFFVHFFARFCTTRTWKCIISRFMEDVNKQRQNFISLSVLGCGPKEFNSSRVRLHLTKYVGRNNCDKDWKNANSLFKRRSHCRRVIWS